MENQYLDVKEIYQSLLDHRKQILGTTGAFILLGGLYLLVATPTYQSTSLLRIQQERGLGDSLLQTVTGGNTMATAQRMNTNAEILKSRSVVEPVIKAVEEANDEGEYPSYDSFVKQHIVTKPFKDTELLEVDVNAETPEKAQEMNDLIIKGFLERLTDLSREQQAQTRAFLQKRAVASKNELADAENKLQAYQVANQMYSANDQVKAFTDKVSSIDKAKAESKLNLESAQAALDTTEGQLDTAGKAVADSPAIQQYKSQLGQLEAEKASYLDKYTSNHPKMQELDNKIAQVQESLNDEISAIVRQKAPSSNAAQQGLLTSKFKNEAIVAAEEAKQEALSKLDAENNKELANLPGKEQGYIRLKRDADVAQEIYVMLAKRLEEAKVAEAMTPNEVQVVDSATLPEKPIAPRKFLTLLIMTLLGFLGSSIAFVVYDLFNKKIKTSEDVESILDLPVIGMIPDASENLPVYEESKPWQKLWNKLRGK